MWLYECHVDFRRNQAVIDKTSNFIDVDAAN